MNDSNLKMNYVNCLCVGGLKANKKCCYALGAICTAPKYEYDYCKRIAKDKNDSLKKWIEMTGGKK